MLNSKIKSIIKILKIGDIMKKIVLTHSINSIVSKFTSLFLAIYLLKITDGNIVTVVMYYLIKYACTILFSYLTLKMVHSNNILNLYRLGLLSNGICLIILLLLGENVKEYVFAFAMLDSFTSILYWSPYKMILYNFQKDNKLKNIFSSNSIVTSLIQIVSTIGMGYLITNLSYSIVFIIIFILTVIAMLLTFKFDSYRFEIRKFKFKNLKNLMKDKRTLKILKIVF